MDLLDGFLLGVGDDLRCLVVELVFLLAHGDSVAVDASTYRGGAAACITGASVHMTDATGATDGAGTAADAADAADGFRECECLDCEFFLLLVVGRFLLDDFFGAGGCGGGGTYVCSMSSSASDIMFWSSECVASEGVPLPLSEQSDGEDSLTAGGFLGEGRRFGVVPDALERGLLDDGLRLGADG